MAQPVFVSVALDVPVVRGDTRFDTIRLRKPGPGELRGLKLVDVVQCDVAAMMDLLPRITEPALVPQEVAELDLSDFLALADQLSGFLPQRASRTASPSA